WLLLSFPPSPPTSCSKKWHTSVSYQTLKIGPEVKEFNLQSEPSTCTQPATTQSSRTTLATVKPTLSSTTNSIKIKYQQGG
ncbi:hypothetical protein L2E82_04078, partial [Cichorium intybus]